MAGRYNDDALNNGFFIDGKDGLLSDEALSKQPELEPKADYSQIPPTPGEAVRAYRDTGPATLLDQAVAKGHYSDAEPWDRYANTLTVGRKQDQSLDLPPQGNMLDPVEANARYAPKGEDWFSKPISEGLAQVTAKQKLENLQRDSDIARFENYHSWPYTLGASAVGFILDPANLAATFVPGIGEEAVAARLGGGMVARIAGRAVSGAIGGAVAQVPSVVAHAALDDQYSLRAAFLDLAMGAAGGAVVQGGIEGVLKEGWRASFGKTASQVHAGISGAIADTVEGKPVDVTPIVYPPASDLAIRQIQDFAVSQYGAPLHDDVAAQAARIGGDPEFAISEAMKLQPRNTLAEIAEHEKSLNENGYAPGMSEAEFLSAKESVDAAATAEPIKPEAARPEPATAGEARTPTGEPSPAAEVKPGEIPASPNAKRLAPEEVDRIIALPEVQQAIQHPREIDRTHDVPYLAGSNNEGGVTFIDRRVPTELGLEGIHEDTVVIDPAIPLNVHEQVEHALMVKGGMPYESAHRIALVEEQKAVEGLGAKWSSYQDAMERLVGTTEHESAKSPPPDLYLKPYPHQEAEFLKRQGAGETAPMPQPGEAPILSTDPEVAAAQQVLINAPNWTQAYTQAAQCLVEAGL